MQRNGYFDRPLRRLTAATIFALIVSGALVSMSAQAQDSIRHLAMVRPNPAKIKVAVTNPIVSEPVHASPSMLSLKVETATLLTGAETNAVVFGNTPIDKQTNPANRDPLVLVRENLNASRSMVVAAGYGQLWNNQSMFKYISSQRQEPGCAYLKASLNF